MTCRPRPWDGQRVAPVVPPAGTVDRGDGAERRVGGHWSRLRGQSVSPPPSVFEAGKARGLHAAVAADAAGRSGRRAKAAGVVAFAGRARFDGVNSGVGERTGDGVRVEHPDGKGAGDCEAGTPPGRNSRALHVANGRLRHMLIGYADGRPRPSTSTSRRPSSRSRGPSLFQSVDPAGERLTGRALTRRVVLAMIKRRAAAAAGLAAVNVLSHVPGDGNHGVPVERRDPRPRAADRGARVAEDDEAL